jgi:glycosyltransferase involved in cell wall biosynthesis
MASALAGFWSGGFEGADHVNAVGVPLDLMRGSGHLRCLEEDHARAADAGFSSVRESIGWRVCENAAGVIDLGRAERVAASADRQGLQVLWTLMHYGVPEGLSLHDDALIPRFARFAERVAKTLGTSAGRSPVFTPINEISFLAWAASQSHLLSAIDSTTGLDDEGVRGRGYDVKCRLVRATLQAMLAMKAIEPRCLFMHAEPLVHVVAPAGQPEHAALAQRVASWQWQVWDLLTGVERPELGGHAGSVDLMGLNHYHNSQWELHTNLRLEWHLRDPRRLSLSALMLEAWRRYQLPMMLAETSHVGAGRERWLHEMAGEVRTVLARSVPVEGFCLYPLIDRPDWTHTAQWHRSGLWHVDPSEPGLPRANLPAFGKALKNWQQYLPDAPSSALPLLVVLCQRAWRVAPHRTQQLMEQLSARWRVVWVDPPVAVAGPQRIDARAGGPNLDVLSPISASHVSGWDAVHHAWLRDALRTHLNHHGGRPAAVWFDDPAALPLAQSLDPGCVVYDAGELRVDHVDASLHARAVRKADVVVSAGDSSARNLQRSSGRSVHSIENGVDLDHFTRRVEDPGIDAPGWAAFEARALQGRRWHPRVGYAGAIDARLDLQLLAGMADARQDWSFVMVGPLVGLNAASLPHRANITWLGEQAFELMPELMSGWSLGWLPWREAGPDANPVEVLEYLACGLPVVAPWISELARLQPAGIRWAVDRAMFHAQCDLILTQPDAARAPERAMARQLLKARSWSASAARAEALIRMQNNPCLGRSAGDHPSKEETARAVALHS